MRKCPERLGVGGTRNKVFEPLFYLTLLLETLQDEGNVERVQLMGRHLTVEQLERRLEIAKKRRADKLAAKIANPKPYKPQPPKTLLYYRSVFDHDIYYRVNVNSETLAMFANPAELGLLATIPDGATALSIKGSGIRPSMIRWYYGDASPQVITTSWGSRYIKNYDDKAGQSHRSIPLSIASGAFDLQDLLNKFNGLFGVNGTKLALLGERGLAEFIPERMPIFS